YEEQQFFNHSAAYGQRSVKDSSIDKSQRPLRIFLLDDDPQVFEYFEFLVTKLPFATQLSHAADSEMGQALVSNTRFDLYILDFDLAGEKNGWDFYQEHLHYLGQEVLFQTTQNEQVLMGSQTRQALRPLGLDTLIQQCEEVYAKRTKLLLVDDSHLTRLVWERFHGKHNIQLAASPEEALHILQSTNENFEYCIVDFYFDNSAMTGEKLAR